MEKPLNKDNKIKLLEKLEDKLDNLDTEPVWPIYSVAKTLTANEKENGSKTHKLPEKQSTICQIKTKPIFFTNINKVGLWKTTFQKQFHSS